MSIVKSSRGGMLMTNDIKEEGSNQPSEKKEFPPIPREN